MNNIRSYFNKDKEDNGEVQIVNYNYKDEKNLISQETKETSSQDIIPQLSISKSQEFDPITSNLIDEVINDDYAGIAVEDDSPYAEVRAAVPSTDDPTLPQSTIRMWTIGMLMTTIGCGMNLLFSLHAPSFAITTFVTSIIAWPLGRAWAAFMPNVHIFGVPLNPGPFNIKEHTIITIMANVSFGGGAAYATDIFLAQNRYYNSDFGWGFEICSILATQCIGLGLGGLARRFVVYPSSAIWPSNLVTTTFLTNLHVNENHPANGWRISRLAFFGVVGLSCFLYSWFPSFIFTGLSTFSWITWIKPNNVIINQVFGSYTGLGMFPNNIALDWNQIAGYIGSPLIPPASVIATILFSLITIFWVVVPALHYSNTWYAQYMPISSSSSYDRYGETYNVSRIVNKKTLSFIESEYKAYSPLFLSTTFAISYGLSFASIMATVVHTALFHGREMIQQLKMKEKPDVHFRLMKQNYEEVPDWWYGLMFLVFFGLSIVTVKVWPTELPVWALVVALLIAIFFILPIAIIYSRTNLEIGLNVVTEFIVGYMVPGKPIAMTLFKTFGYITCIQGITYSQDLKLSFYMKIKPKLIFYAQVIASIWGAIVQVSVLRWSYGSIHDLCNPDPSISDNYTCPNGKVFFNASIIWGVIGPQRQFSYGQIYYGLLFFFVIGAAMPLISWLILKKWPKSPIKWVHWPVFFGGTGYIPPATAYNYSSYCTIGLVFGWWIKKKWFHWWSKYNYTLSAGLDIGLAFCLLVIFLTLNLTNTSFPEWWGNTYTASTMDQSNTAVRVQAPAEGFGPTTW